MSDLLPPELLSRCNAIQDGHSQGVPLSLGDYFWFAVATIIVPAIMVIAGALL